MKPPSVVAEEAESEEAEKEAAGRPNNVPLMEGWLKEAAETDECAAMFAIEVDSAGAEVNLASTVLFAVLDNTTPKVVSAVEGKGGIAAGNEALGTFEIPASWQ